MDPGVLELYVRAIEEFTRRRGDEHLVRPGQGHHPRRRVDGHAADIAAHERDLARVDTDSDRESELLRRAGHRGRAPHGPRRPIEDRKEAVAGRLDLPPAIRVQVVTDAGVVESQQLLPGPIADLFERRGRVDDVGEEHGREDPLARIVRPDADDVGARPLDRQPGLLSHDPGIVARRDLVDGVGRDVECLAVVHAHVQDAGHGMAEMVDLAARRAHDRGKIGRPAPAGAEFGPCDARFIETDDRGTTLRDRSEFVGSGEALEPQSRHGRPIIGPRPRWPTGPEPREWHADSTRSISFGEAAVATGGLASAASSPRHAARHHR